MPAPIKITIDDVQYNSIAEAAIKLKIGQDTIARKLKDVNFTNYTINIYSIPENKFCKTCGIVKPLTEFAKDNKRKDGRKSYCKQCKNKSAGNWRSNNKIRIKGYNLKTDYSISMEEYNQLLLKQEYKCAICGNPQKDKYDFLSVDHCHTTDKIRGLLCTNCNIGLGHFKDNIENLISAIKYLNNKI